MHAVRSWCAPLLAAAGGPVPLLGSRSWIAADDPTRLASLARAALAWLADCDQLAIGRDLAHHLALVDVAVAERFKGAAVDLAEACDWAAASRRPSYLELQRRRGAVA